MPGIKEAAITRDIAIDSSHLPGNLHGDPMGRLVIATARHLGMPVVTGDRKIIAYAKHRLRQRHSLLILIEPCIDQSTAPALM